MRAHTQTDTPPQAHSDGRSGAVLRAGGGLEIADLLDEVLLLLVELDAVGAVGLEVREEVYELLLVLVEDGVDALWLVWVGHEYLRGRERGD